ncbi:MAG: TonB-dependent receptor [Opitutaceae bacterium]|nr:TonB-dependent receptor [Opitutaceae bacterium]
MKIIPTTRLLLALTFTAGFVLAQAPAPSKPEETVRLEAFAVTGSYLKRLEQEKALPVTILTSEEIKTRGVTTAAELFATIPQAGRVPISESQASGADARGDIATVSLRGLGSGNTLVLLNGRRLAPHPISMPEGGTGVPSMGTNINALPSAAIERIEVLRDGASAIYGTDATAGVVNTLLRRSYDGFDVATRFGTTEHGGGTEWRATLSGGLTFNARRTKLVFNYDFLDRTEIRNSDRDFSRNADFRLRVPAPWNGSTADNTVDLRSDRGFFGRFQRGTVTPANTVTGARPAGVAATQLATNGTFYFVPASPGSTTRVLQATEPDRSVTSPVGDYYMNVGAFRFLLPATRRHNLYASLDHEFSKALTFFSDFTFYRADSHNEREPSRIDSTADNNIFVSAGNPYNPFGSRFYSATGAPNADGTPRITGTPSDVVLTRVTVPEFGPRLIDVRSEAWRALGGLRGKIFDRWQWESAALYSRSETVDLESNAIKESQLRDAAQRTDSTALNPFMTTFSVVNGALTTSGARFVNPESVIAPLRGTFYRRGETTLGSWDVRVNGPLFQLTSGPLALATGAEYRRETYIDFRDAESGRLSAADVSRLGLQPRLIGDNNYIQVSPSDNTDANRNVTGVFAEIAVPLVGAGRSDSLQSLEFSSAVRYEKYSDFGHTTKPKFGLSARVLQWVMLRGSFNEAFRAPNLASLFSGAVQRSITGVNDAYRAAATGSSDDGTTARRISLRTGNRGLSPEESDTFTVGVVLEPPALKGFSIGLDWWSLKQSDAITRLDSGNIIAEDTALLTAANAAAASRPIDQVDLSKAGSPNIIRNPVTPADLAAFAAYNATRPRAQQRAAVGTIRFVGESYLNAAGRTLSGLDLLVAYRSPKTSFGTFRATAEASHLRQFDETLVAGDPVRELSWTDGNTRWKGSLTLTWKHGDWAAGWVSDYTGRTKDPSIRTTATGSHISSEGYLIVGDQWVSRLNVSRQFRGKGWLGNTSVRIGINNLFDAQPPFALGGDTDGYLRGFGDPRGRAFNLELTKRF